MTAGGLSDLADHVRILDVGIDADRAVVDRLSADPGVALIDRLDHQRDSLRRLVPPPDPALTDESPRWVYYPWRRTLIHVLGPQSFRRLRLDRNRNMITAAEQDRLGQLRIGVVGLSVGHVIAHTLAAEGLVGRLLLADYDDLELSNLNRVPATVFDLGENKATIAARRIAELDPYLDVEVLPTGLTDDTLTDFVVGLDILIEETDSLDIKATVRRAARAARIPVVMATSDRGMVDVERFDLEPDRPVLHGLLTEADIGHLAGLSSRDKIPHVLRIVDAAHGSARGAASMLELGQTLSTWPQLAGDVILGAAAVAEAVRRIGLGEPLPSGRVRIDVGDALDRIAEPAPSKPPASECSPIEVPAAGRGAAAMVAETAARAPSGGNMQPWRIDYDAGSVTIALAPELSAIVDVGHRSSAVAVGAAVFNARVAAASAGILGPVEWTTDADDSPLRAVLRFANGTDAALAALYEPTMARETNRRIGTPDPIDEETVAQLLRAASSEGAALRLLTGAEELRQIADILAACDRIRFLTPRLHAEMRTEVRWPGDPNPDTGIDVASLELDAGGVAALDLLRRPDVMTRLADWDAGSALGADTRTRILASSAVGVVSITGNSLLDLARGGSAAEAIWVAANSRGLAVQPCTPLFAHARNVSERHGLSPMFARELDNLAYNFDELVRPVADEVIAIVFRFSRGPAASVRSRRRPVVSDPRSSR